MSAATRCRRANTATVAAIATHSRAISTRASPGRLRPKNSSGHAALSASCAPYRVSAGRDSRGFARQTSQAETAFAAYSTVHTGPNTSSGGRHDGRSSDGYQVRTPAAVPAPPMPAATATAPNDVASAAAERVRETVVIPVHAPAASGLPPHVALVVRL